MNNNTKIEILSRMLAALKGPAKYEDNGLCATCNEASSNGTDYARWWATIEYEFTRFSLRKPARDYARLHSTETNYPVKPPKGFDGGAEQAYYTLPLYSGEYGENREEYRKYLMAYFIETIKELQDEITASS